jgi:arginine-tRNA-protein transferase
MSAFAEKHYPELLLPEELDAYLARGWYRMGQSIFTTHYLCFGEQFFSAIWIRLELGGHAFSKSQRKLMRRNGQRFRVHYQPAEINREKELLYQRYRRQFRGTLAPNLQESLLDGEEFNIYQTLECQILDGDQLVGLSFFDLGRDSAASIMGVYDPNYADFSLGYYTMLLEIAYCLEQGLQYYYPGYVVPGYDRFDYKLRIGPVEYLNLEQWRWLPYAELHAADIPLERMRRQLLELQLILERTGHKARLLHYPLFEANLFGFWNAPYVDFPILLQCLPHPSPTEASYHVVFDIRDNVYRWLRCTPFDDLQFYFNESYTNAFDPERFFMQLVIIDTILAKAETAEEMAETIIANWRHL